MDKKPFFDAFRNTGTAPPRDTAHGADPSTTTPGDEQVRLPVGGKIPEESFVTVSQLKTHLGLLRAFRELKDRVVNLEANQEVRDKLPPMAQELGPQERWTWFLELALERSSLRNLALIWFSLTFTLQVPSLGFEAAYFTPAEWHST